LIDVEVEQAFWIVVVNIGVVGSWGTAKGFVELKHFKGLIDELLCKTAIPGQKTLGACFCQLIKVG